MQLLSVVCSWHLTSSYFVLTWNRKAKWNMIPGEDAHLFIIFHFPKTACITLHDYPIECGVYISRLTITICDNTWINHVYTWSQNRYLLWARFPRLVSCSTDGQCGGRGACHQSSHPTLTWRWDRHFMCNPSHMFGNQILILCNP